MVYRLVFIFFSIVSCSDFSRNYNVWPGGIIPYHYISKFTIEEKNIIRESMGELESIANIQFIENDEYSDNCYIISKGDSNWSTVGYSDNDDNFYSIYTTSKITILHELLHCLGLDHEHQRYDRDLYVDILWDNIYAEYLDEFYKIEHGLINIKKFSYDYQSIMHYGNYTFSKNNGMTIDSYNNEIGTWSISEIDKQKLIYLYGLKGETKWLIYAKIAVMNEPELSNGIPFYAICYQGDN